MIKKEHVAEDGTKSYAIYSDSEKHRYVLNRVWDVEGKCMLFVGLNPSTATEVANDPTVARVINYAKRENFGSAVVCNIFSYRATLPSDMRLFQDPIGKENDKHILEESEKADIILLGWGNHASFLDRGKSVLKLLQPYREKLYCLGFTKSLEPKHPLYLRKDAKFETLNK